jgi:hypothetical protein
MNNYRANRPYSRLARRSLLVLSALFGFGCQSFLDLAVRTLPPWDCVRAGETMSLYEELDLSGARPQLKTLSGVLEDGVPAQVLEFHKGLHRAEVALPPRVAHRRPGLVRGGNRQLERRSRK